MAVTHPIDKENLMAVIEQFPKQIEAASRLTANIKLENIQHIVVCGMGGSGLPGDIARNMCNNSVPFITVKDYTLPQFINKNSLVFVISYSGNTEETHAAYEEAKKRSAQIVVITSGGDLAARAKEDKIPIILVPSGLQPRMAFGYQTIPILNVLQSANLIAPINWNKVVGALNKCQEIDFTAIRIADFLEGKIPIIYSSPQFASVAYKWKININENAKTHAFCNYFPEFNHNEINGFVNLKGNYAVIILRDHDDHPRIKKRMEVIEQLLRDKMIPVMVIDRMFDDLPARILGAIWLGDWVSYHVALDLKTDPTPVMIIEDLKKALK